MDTGRRYRLYEGKAKVLELMHSLNSKGIKEKALHDSIHYFIKEGVIHDVTGPQEEEKPFDIESLRLVKEKVTMELVKTTIIDIESKFTAYLSSRNCRWAHIGYRAEFIKDFSVLSDFKSIKQAILDLQ